jgi:hypothetical protein
MAPKNYSLEMMRYHPWTATCELPDGSIEPILGVFRYRSRAAEYELPDGFKEPFFRGVLRYHSWTAAYELPDGSTEVFFRDVEIPLMDRRQCVTNWAIWWWSAVLTTLSDDNLSRIGPFGGGVLY